MVLRRGSGGFVMGCMRPRCVICVVESRRFWDGSKGSSASLFALAE